MKNFKRRALPALLALTLLLGTGAALATGGNKTDPLITLSYLEDTVVPEILAKLNTDTKNLNKDLKADLAAQIDVYESDMEQLLKAGSATGSDTYVLITLSKGQSMALDVGCEMMLRVGTVTVNAATSPALIDVTTGGSINSGASLEKNHLYMSTIPDRTLASTTETAKLLVRGGYTIVDAG
jgi:hypothetical protein